LKKTLLLLLSISVLAGGKVQAQSADAQALYTTVRQKVFAVKDYTADVELKIDVTFMRVPKLRGTLYFKSPDKLRLVRKNGLSIMPQRTVNMSLAGLLPAGETTVIDAGTDVINGSAVRVVKVVPEGDAGDIVLTKLWIDEARKLVMRSETTTRDNGTFLMDLVFGKYAAQSLPDQMTLNMDVKEYKMPKGVTMDYEGGDKPVVPPKEGKGKRRKGRIQITYDSYQVNTGLSDAIFKEKEKR
jgi:hypothetical protein